MITRLTALALLCSLPAWAGPVEIRTQFRPRIEPTRMKVELPSMAALRERVAQDASVHVNVLRPLIKEGKLGDTVAFDPAVVKAASKKAFDKYELAHAELMKEMAKYDKREPDESELKTLMDLFKAREDALNDFVREGVKDKFIELKDKGHWNITAQVEAATQGSKGSSINAPTGKHTSEEASRAVGDTIKTKPGEEYDRMVKDLSKTFQSHASIGDAVLAIYGEKALEAAAKKAEREKGDPVEKRAEMKEKAVLVVGKLVDLLDRIANLGDRAKLDWFKSILEAAIHSEAGPAEMEAVVQMAAGSKGDNTTGLTRIVQLDAQMRDSKLDGARRGERLSEWLSAGADFRDFVSPDTNGWGGKNKAVLDMIGLAAREHWLETGKLPTEEDMIKRAAAVWTRPGIKNDQTYKGALEAKDFRPHLERLKLAEAQLAKAKAGKGEDRPTEHLICTGECKLLRCRGA